MIKNECAGVTYRLICKKDARLRKDYKEYGENAYSFTNLEGEIILMDGEQEVILPGNIRTFVGYNYRDKVVAYTVCESAIKNFLTLQNI